jgi:pyruvate carboxylase
MRTIDLLRIAEATGRLAPDLFSMEVWGGATFDTAYRFLKEDPWERLASSGSAFPHILFQMLLRGQSLLGYSAYPDNAVQAFVREAADTGIDVFRIFDSLNWLPNMQVAIDAVREEGQDRRGGDLLHRGPPRRRPREVRPRLLRRAGEGDRGGRGAYPRDQGHGGPPQARRRGACRRAPGGGRLPIHLHTHDSAGVGVASAASGALAGAHVVDGCIDALAGGTSQPSLRAIAARSRARIAGTDRPGRGSSP